MSKYDRIYEMGWLAALDGVKETENPFIEYEEGSCEEKPASDSQGCWSSGHSAGLKDLEIKHLTCSVS